MKKNAKVKIFISIIIIISILIFIPPQYEKKTLIVIGGELPPFEYSENKGIKGIHVEYIEKILTNLNKKYEIRLVNWNKAIESTKKGNADIMFSVLYNKERAKFLDFPGDFNSTKIPETSLWIEQYLFFYKNGTNLNLSQEKIKENKYKIALIKGYAYSDALYNQNLNFVTYNSEQEAINAVFKEEADFVVLNLIAGEQIIRSQGLSNLIIPHNEILFTNPNFIVFSKEYEDTEFKKKFYEELIRLKKEQNLHNELYEKYIGKTFDQTYSKLIS